MLFYEWTFFIDGFKLILLHLAKEEEAQYQRMWDNFLLFC